MSVETRCRNGLSALVPRRLLTDPRAMGFRESSGLVLFADIAGFTRLTENARKRSGSRGIEELTGKINAILGDLINAALDNGGDILKFGGDAILVAFDDDGDRRRCVRLSLQCASDMHRAIRQHRRSVSRSLNLHLGMATGKWFELIAGKVGSRREHFVWGEAVIRAMSAADSSGRLARIVCDAKELPRPSALTITTVSRGIHDFDPANADRLHRSVVEVSEAPPNEELWDFVPEILRPDTNGTQHGPSLSAEHRPVATVFASWRCPRTMSDPTRCQQFLSEIFGIVQRAQASQSGLWARSDPAGKKQKFLMLFGATQSGPDDTDRALQCVSTLREEFARLKCDYSDFACGFGLTAATVYTGYAGSERRREFTAMGDGVNLAARLAAKARPGTALVDRAAKDAATRTRFRPAGILMLKNVRRPTHVFTPCGAIDLANVNAAYNIVEHPRAMQECLDWWESDRTALHVEARSGVDVLSFLSMLLNRVGASETERCYLSFDSSHASHPLGGVCAILKSAEAATTPADQNASSGVLGDLFDPSGNAAARLLSRLGPERAATEVARQCMPHLRTGLFTILDHIEALGEFDQRVIQRLSETAPGRWLFIRHVSYSGPPNAESGATVVLGELGRDEFAVVLGDVLSPGRASRSLLDFLYKHSSGNSRLARSFLSHLIAEGSAARSGGRHAVWQLRNPDGARLPDGLRAHYLQRVDRLPSQLQTVLRAVSLLGDSASPESIRVLCDEFSESEISEFVCQLETQDLVIVHSSGGVDRVTVADPTCRQAVYETMSYHLRESWHHRAANYCRSRASVDPALVGEHLFRARSGSAARWLERAARNARRFWSLDRARLFTRWTILALQGQCDPEYAPILPPLKNSISRREAGQWSSLADILRLQGMHHDAGRIHGHLARVAVASGDRHASCVHRLTAARIEWYAGQYEQCGRHTSSVLRAVRRLKDADLIAQSAFLLGETYRRTGRVVSAQRSLTEAERLLRTTNHRNLKSDVLNAMGLLHWNCGRLAEARSFFERSLRTLGRRGDPSRRGQVANNLGILHEEQGDLKSAAKFYERAFTVFDRTGVRRHRAYSLGNLANLHRHAARYERARAAYEEVDTELRTMGEAHAAAYTVGNLGDLARDFGNYAEARIRYEDTLQFAEKSGDEELKAETYARLAHLHLLSGRLGQMQPLLKKARRSAARVESREFKLYAQLLLAERDFATANSAAARRRLSAIGRDARQAGLVLYQLWTALLTAKLDAETFSPNVVLTSIRVGMLRARRCGYRWWELRFASLAASIPQSVKSRSRWQRLTHRLTQEIANGIGDPDVRSQFLKTHAALNPIDVPILPLPDSSAP